MTLIHSAAITMMEKPMTVARISMAVEVITSPGIAGSLLFFTVG